MLVDPRLIMQFQAVAEWGSITRAAEAIGISQPALSNGIASLERSLGAKLLHRTRHGSKLTELGVAVSRSATTLNSLLTTMIDEVKARAAGFGNALSIGATPVAAATVLPEAIARLAINIPDLTVSIIEGTDDQLLELLLKGKIELSVGPIGVDAVPSSVIEDRLFADPFVLAVRAGHRLSVHSEISLAELTHEKWILPDHGSAYRRQIEAIFLTNGFKVPHSSINTNSRAMTEELLIKTDRVTIVSHRLTSRPNCVRFKSIKLRGSGAPRLIGTKRFRDVPPSHAAAALLHTLREISEQNSPPPSAAPKGLKEAARLKSQAAIRSSSQIPRRKAFLT